MVLGAHKEAFAFVQNSDGAYVDDDTSTSDEQLIRKALGMEDSEEEDGNAMMMLDDQALHELVARELTGDSSTNDNNDSVVISLPGTSDGTGMDITPPPPERQRHLTGRCPTILYLSCDPETLSDYQCLVRKQIELFEANENDVLAGAQGRNKPIVLGQVGIRCRHCAYVPLSSRGRSAVFYPSKLLNVYQASQNIATHHLQDTCSHIPISLKDELCALKDRKTRAHGGKEHWAKLTAALGVYDDVDGLRYFDRMQL